MFDDESGLNEIENEIKKVNKRQWEERVKEAIEKEEDGWKITNRMVMWQERVYVPVVMKLQ